MTNTMGGNDNDNDRDKDKNVKDKNDNDNDNDRDKDKNVHRHRQIHFRLLSTPTCQNNDHYMMMRRMTKTMTMTTLAFLLEES